MACRHDCVQQSMRIFKAQNNGYVTSEFSVSAIQAPNTVYMRKPVVNITVLNQTTLDYYVQIAVQYSQMWMTSVKQAPAYGLKLNNFSTQDVVSLLERKWCYDNK